MDRKRVFDICEALIRKNIKIKWSASCRIDYVDSFNDDFISLLRRSGLTTLTLGAESGSDRVLESINKHLTVDQIIRTNIKMKTFDIDCYYNFMVGIPGETKEDIVKTYQLIERLIDDNPRCRFYAQMAYVPFPGTQLYQKSVSLGFEQPRSLDDWKKIDFSYRSIVTHPWVGIELRRFITNTSFVIKHVQLDNVVLQHWFRVRLKNMIKSIRSNASFFPFIDKAFLMLWLMLQKVSCFFHRANNFRKKLTKEKAA